MKIISKSCKQLEALREKIIWFPPLLTRISIGAVFLEAGWGKIHHLDKVIAFFTDLGIPAPQLQAPFVAGTELVCGFLLLLGLMTRLASVPLIVSMVVATLTAKKEELHSITDLFSISEYLYIVGLVWLIFYGAGFLSLDQFIKSKLGKQNEAPGRA